MKLFVGNLSWTLKDDDLKDHFSQTGTVTSAKVIMDRETGRSRGFGFVEYQMPEAANLAIETLDGTELGGRPLKVAKAQERNNTKVAYRR